MKTRCISVSASLEHLTVTAVIVSLFVGRLKLRPPLADPARAAAFRPAAPVLVAISSHPR